MTRLSNPAYRAPESYPVRDRSISDLDYLQYLMDECDYKGDSFANSFFPSAMSWLAKSGGNVLSIKQGLQLNRYVSTFGLVDDVKKGFLYAGYYNDVISGAPKRTVHTEKATVDSDDLDDLSDMDDDFPF